MLSLVHLLSQKSPLVLTSHLPADATITMHSVRGWRDLGGGRKGEGEAKHELLSALLSSVQIY